MKNIDREIMNYNFIEKMQGENPDIKYNPELLFQKDLSLKKILKIQEFEQDELKILEDNEYELEKQYFSTKDEKYIPILEDIKQKIYILTN